jgi:hypothetical protein
MIQAVKIIAVLFSRRTDEILVRRPILNIVLESFDTLRVGYGLDA